MDFQIDKIYNEDCLEGMKRIADGASHGDRPLVRRNRPTLILRLSCSRMSVNSNSCNSARTECPTISTPCFESDTGFISIRIKGH